MNGKIPLERGFCCCGCFLLGFFCFLLGFFHMSKLSFPVTSLTVNCL